MKFEFRVKSQPADQKSDSVKWYWRLWRDDASDVDCHLLEVGDIAAGALKVAAQVSACEQALTDPDVQAAFRYMFANANVVSDSNSTRPAWVRFDDTEEKPNALRAVAVFYQGIYLYLRDGDRYASLNADLALLLSAWQWYTAYSRLLSQDSVEKSGKTNLYQYGQAHKALATLLEDGNFDLAAQWMAFLRKPSGDLPLVRERLRTGMVLEYTPSTPKGLRSLHHALAAPGAFEPISWENTRLLPILYKNEGGKALVRRLISDWLLTRYDFLTSIHLARLLRENKPQKHIFQAWMMLIWLVIWVCGMIAYNFIFQPYQPVTDSDTAVRYSMTIFSLGPLTLIIMAGLWFEFRSIINLALPRLSGGIALGYVAFILQEDAIDLALRFWEPGKIPLAFLWVGALILGYAYLYYDVLPRGRTKFETRIRAILSLVAASLISIGIGFFMVALSTAAYGVCDEPMKCFLGPLGWINWQQFLALVPLALTTGLITQFVLEERPVTAPVWSSDES